MDINNIHSVRFDLSQAEHKLVKLEVISKDGSTSEFTHFGDGACNLSMLAGILALQVICLELSQLEAAFIYRKIAERENLVNIWNKLRRLLTEGATDAGERASNK